MLSLDLGCKSPDPLFSIILNAEVVTQFVLMPLLVVVHEGEGLLILAAISLHLLQFFLNEAVDGPEFAEFLITLIVLLLPLNGRVKPSTVLFPKCFMLGVSKRPS